MQDERSHLISSQKHSVSCIGLDDYLIRLLGVHRLEDDDDHIRALVVGEADGADPVVGFDGLSECQGRVARWLRSKHRVLLVHQHAAAGELTGDPKLKAKISAYQLAVEQAIVGVEGSDGEQAKLKAVIESPALRSAEKAVLTACA